MIYYLVTYNHRYTVQRYLSAWGGSGARQIQIVDYESLPGRSVLPIGTYIFSDFERLTSSELGMARDVARQLKAARRGVRILNDPDRVLLRYDLLNALHADGVNQFNAYRLDDADQATFPVFLRHEDTHAGSLTPPLASARELRTEADRLVASGTDSARLLVVEFCDTADPDGFYRKYGAFLIGDRVIPRHELIGSNWIMKQDSALADERFLQEERAYLDTNPHASWIREVFAIAGIDYGRIDYGMLDGRPQAWEINTNPSLLRSRSGYHPRQLPQQERFARQLPPAFAAIDHPDGDGDEPIPVTIDAPDPRPPRRHRGLAGLLHRGRRRLARRRRRAY